MSLEDSKLWDLYALCYDAVNESPPYRQLLTSVIHALDLQSGQRILDAGCGTGNLPALISKLGLKELEIEAGDNSPAMLTRARRKKIPLKIKFHLADLNQHLSYADNYFDRVVAIHVLYALKDPQATLRELFRVLKPGGLLVLANPHSDSKPSEIMKANLAGLNIAGKAWLLITKLPLIVINLFICRLGRLGSYHFLSEPEIRSLLTEAGFVEINAELAYADQDLLLAARKPPRKSNL